ncbi:hypothetical protein P8452_41842 [Trifolium repens]|nr:hypothetical protein P8452_41842 [Trifolium repens]
MIHSYFLLLASRKSPYHSQGLHQFPALLHQFLCLDAQLGIVYYYRMTEFHIIKLLLEKLYFITSISSKPSLEFEIWEQ